MFAATHILPLRIECTDLQPPLMAFCNLYRNALVNSDRLCLCGMLGAESCGLPDSLAKAVAAFFQANIDWVASALPEELGANMRSTKATQIVASLQGAMMMANSLQDHSLFERAADEVMEAINGLDQQRA